MGSGSHSSKTVSFFPDRGRLRVGSSCFLMVFHIRVAPSIYPKVSLLYTGLIDGKWPCWRAITHRSFARIAQNNSVVGGFRQTAGHQNGTVAGSSAQWILLMALMASISSFFRPGATNPGSSATRRFTILASSMHKSFGSPRTYLRISA